MAPTDHTCPDAHYPYRQAAPWGLPLRLPLTLMLTVVGKSKMRLYGSLELGEALLSPKEGFWLRSEAEEEERGASLRLRVAGKVVGRT